METKSPSSSACIDSLFSWKQKIAWFDWRSLVYDTLSFHMGGRSIHPEQGKGMVKRAGIEDLTSRNPLRQYQYALMAPINSRR